MITPNLTEALLLLYGKEGMKERMKALSDMEETQLLKEIETSGRELTQRFGLEAIVITGVEVSGSDGRARMESGSGKEKQTGVFCKEAAAIPEQEIFWHLS